MSEPPNVMPPCEPITVGEILSEMPQEIAEDRAWFISLDNSAREVGRDSIPMAWPFYCKQCRAKITYVEMMPEAWQPVCTCIQH